MEQPRALLEVRDAAGRTASQAADEIMAEALGFDISRTTTTIAGEEAVILDNLPGQDLNRQVVVVHQGRLYKFTFTPMGGDTAGVESLYRTMMNSFSFLPQG